LSNNPTTTITVLISILLATSTFLAVATSQPTPQIISQQNSEYSGGKFYSIANSGSKYTLNCTLPPTPTGMKQIKGSNIPITLNETKKLMKSLFGSEPTSIAQFPWEQVINVPGGSVSLFDYSTLVYDSSTVDVNKMDDFTAIRAVADGFKDKVTASVPFKGFSLVYDGISIGMSTIVNGTRYINYWTVIYRAEIDGVPIYGADLSVGVCNGEIVSVSFTLPKIEGTTNSVAVISPAEALMRLGRGEFNGSIGYNSVAYVNKVTLGYWYVPSDADNSTSYQPKLIYCIEGVSVQAAYKDSFSVYVPAS
jgi:hypothetical protein